jgi:hypothetical protein
VVRDIHCWDRDFILHAIFNTWTCLSFSQSNFKLGHARGVTLAFSMHNPKLWSSVVMWLHLIHVPTVRMNDLNYLCIQTKVTKSSVQLLLFCCVEIILLHLLLLPLLTMPTTTNSNLPWLNRHPCFFLSHAGFQFCLGWQWHRRRYRWTAVAGGCGVVEMEASDRMAPMLCTGMTFGVEFPPTTWSLLGVVLAI